MSDNDYVNLEEASLLLGWRGHSGYFNSQQMGFPNAIHVEGQKKYSLKEIISWDKERPLGVSENISNGEMPIIMKNNIIL